MILETKIRKLARSSYYQTLYRNSKDLGCIQIFENKKNFSGLQTLFLYWLKVYNMLYQDCVDKEYDNLTKNVIIDDIRTDAFLYYKQDKHEKEINERKKEDRHSKSASKGGKKGHYNDYSIYRGPAKT